MKVLILVLSQILLCCSQQEQIKQSEPKPIEDEDFIRKEVSALIEMTLEFVKDMNMKMRDVRRVERFYYGTMDFGAGRIYTTMAQKFDRMVQLYRNYSTTGYLLDKPRHETDVFYTTHTLQYMFSEYNEILSLIDIFKERYRHWKVSSARWFNRDTITKFLQYHNVFPSNWEDREDEWR